MTIRSRINFTLVISILLILFLVSFLYVNEKKIHNSSDIRSINQSIIDDLYTLNNLSIKYFLYPGNDEDAIAIDNIENKIAQSINLIKQIEILPSEFDDELSDLSLQEDELNALLSQANDFKQFQDDIIGQEMLKQFQSVLTNFISRSIALTNANENYVSNLQSQSFTISFIVLFLISIIYLVNALIINRTIKYPIARFNEAIEKISAGDMNAKVNVYDRNELGKLAKTFNSMLSSIRRQEKEKYEFISTISHQLRTPISSILWTAESIAGVKNKEEIATITEKSQDLNSIVDHLLFYLEMTNKPLNEADFTQINIAEIIQKILDEIKKKISAKKIKVKFNNSLGKLEVLANEKYLVKILDYIINNAIVYNKPSGTIEIDLKKTDHHIHLEISDTGYGIPAKEQLHIFKKFFRASNASLGKNEGSGISLYLAKLLIRQFGGTIELESHENKGTRVDITLPVAK